MKPARVLAAVALLAPPAALPQGWAPQKNVELIVPSAPGGTNDKLARAIETTLAGGKRPITVAHRSGGGGQIAYGYLAQHVGDPHYLAVVSPTLLTAHITGTSRLGYADLTPIASIFNDYMVLSVNAGSAVKSGKELAARMRADAPSMPLGFSSQVGNHHHIAAGLFMKAIGAAVRDLKPVVLKGSAEALTAVLGNHIQLASTGAANAVPHAAAGKLRILGVSAAQRLPGPMADVPTWKEQGVDMTYGSWRTIFAPRGLTAEQAAYWEGAMRKVVESPEWKADLERFFWSDYFATGAVLRKNLDKEYADTKAILVDLGLAKP